MKSATKEVKAVCPNCGEDVHLPERLKVCQIVLCKSCGVELEIIATKPPVLDWPYIPDYDTCLDVDGRHWPWNVRD